MCYYNLHIIKVFYILFQIIKQYIKYFIILLLRSVRALERLSVYEEITLCLYLEISVLSLLCTDLVFGQLILSILLVLFLKVFYFVRSLYMFHDVTSYDVLLF
eukprot:TRINITY_DN7811_c0_g1_i3.p7 TRINITY_DN7811_c0_g1~~TRINITY_DN7811_c0_g1_i3.p7  ORF type:complete len:103 (-),score=3.04 TRINITY_DN7811_c0_g1_i3:333-641(-)